MKKVILFMVMSLAFGGFVAAQRWQNGLPLPGTVTVSGTLQLQNGGIVVANGDEVYFVPALERYIGFIDGLKEGAQVSIEGYVYGNWGYSQLLEPSKLTLNGKNYDMGGNLAQRGYRRGYGNNYGMGGNPTQQYGYGYMRRHAGQWSCRAWSYGL